MAKNVKIYTLDYCPFCTKAKIFLESLNVQYEEIRCEDDEQEYREFLTKEYNLPSLATFPQIIIDGYDIGGYSDLIDKYANKEIVF